MRIIIAGAGDIGFSLAQLLAYENKDIVLIDTDTDVLEYADSHLDALTIEGDSSSIEVLQEAGAQGADIVLAVTTSEKNNIVTSILAKKLGAKRTIARVKNSEYLEDAQRSSFFELGIDNLISPQGLAASEVKRLVNLCSFTDIFHFEDGKMSIVGVTLDRYSPVVNHPLSDLNKAVDAPLIMPMALLRGAKTIIPSGSNMLRPNDHVYFLCKTKDLDEVEQFIGKQKRIIKKVMIIGGSTLSYQVSKLLEQDYNVTLVAENKDYCKRLAEELSNTLVIHGKASNVELLEEEGLSNMDAFIALTDNSETNIIASLTAKNHGVFKTIAQVENKEYVHISQNIGVDTLINMKLIAANNIFRHVRKGRIEAITTLQGVDAEVIEFVVTKANQLTKKPLKELHFPDTARVGGVIRGEETIIAGGDTQLQVNDKVIVFARPRAIAKLEKLFR